MYVKVKSFEEIDLEKYGEYRLCYVDDIEETVYNDAYDPSDFRMTTGPFIDNPDYIEGVSEKWAFFTSNFQDQWGDDWDDAPYEHNAGYPYDSDYDPVNRESTEHTILQVPFCISQSWWTRYPDSYGCGNSPFSVKMINQGAVPWIFATSGNRDNEKVLVIPGGVTVSEFIFRILE